MRVIRLVVLVSVLAAVLFVLGTADTPGAHTAPGSDAEAGSLSWTGPLVEGQPKAVRIILHDGSFIMWKDQGGSTTPTVRFIVEHSDVFGFGNVIRGYQVSTRTWCGELCLVEEAQIPIQQREGSWIGTVTIVPHPSVTYLGVCKNPNVNHVDQPHFGVVVDEIKPSESSSKKQRSAGAIHEEAWKNITAKAGNDKYCKYSIYTSRTLAVRHPEVYLRGDALFLEHVTTEPGFAAAYEEPNPHNPLYRERQNFPGPPFSLDQVDLSALKIVEAGKLYPGTAPFYPYLDRRVLPIASTLKTVEGKATELEKAFLLYFLWKAEQESLPFIIYCQNEETYLATPDDLFSIREWSYVNNVTGNPVLIFNERSVWYPLMNRDDTATDPSLELIVDRYKRDQTYPQLADFEAGIVDALMQVTTLEGQLEEDLATLAAVRGIPWYSETFRGICSKYLKGYPLDLWFAILDNWVHRANYLSPFAAHLAGIIDLASAYTTVEAMVDRWHRTRGCRHGHIWRCSLVKYTIDEVMRIHYVHCVLQANCISSILDLAGVRNYVIKGAPERSDITHTFVSIPDIGYVVSNGEITDRGTVINVDPHSGREWNTLWYIAHGERWAFPYLGFYCGNWSPEDLAERLEYMEDLYGDEIHGFKAPRGGTGGQYHFRRSFVHSDAYIPLLKYEQLGWQPFPHP